MPNFPFIGGHEGTRCAAPIFRGAIPGDGLSYFLGRKPVIARRYQSGRAQAHCDDGAPQGSYSIAESLFDRKRTDFIE